MNNGNTLHELVVERDRWVVKANTLIQNSRFNLNLRQQRILLYLISRIKPTDKDFQLYEFNLTDFCQVIGIGLSGGRDYADLKEQIQELASKCVWVKMPGDKEVLCRWIEKAIINHKSGTLQIRLDNDMRPFLLELKNNFTQYELIYTLQFKCKYSIRLYELIKSFHFDEQFPLTKTFEIDELKKRLSAETYKEYRDFKRFALAPAVREINNYSDKDIEVIETKRGRKVLNLTFNIYSKPSEQTQIIFDNINKELGINKTTQLSFWEF